MKIKQLDERTKTLLLSVGIVLVLCIFGIRVVPRLLPHGPQGQLLVGGASTSPASGRPAMATAFPAATPPVTGTTSVAPLSAGPATDPFWRPLALSLQPARQNSAPMNRPSTGIATIAKSGLPAGAAGLSARSGPLALAPVAPPPMPDVSLQGIVQDATAIAVLEVGGQSRFLKAGETLEGGWKLASIQTSTVILRQGQREVVLTLGQSLPKLGPKEGPKETPQETPQENQDLRGVAQTLPPFHSVPLPH